MKKLYKSTTATGQLLCALGIFVVALALQGCIKTNVTCGDADGSPDGRGACAQQASSGEKVNGVTCTGGFVCTSNGANCTRTNPPKKCTTVMPAGGTVCACDCLTQ